MAGTARLDISTSFSRSSAACVLAFAASACWTLQWLHRVLPIGSYSQKPLWGRFAGPARMVRPLAAMFAEVIVWGQHAGIGISSISSSSSTRMGGEEDDDVDKEEEEEGECEG